MQDPLTEWSHLYTVKISFWEVAVAFVKFGVKEVKLTKKKVITWLPYQSLAPYNTGEEE